MYDGSFKNGTEVSGIRLFLLMGIIMDGFNATICSSSLHAVVEIMHMVLEVCQERNIKVVSILVGCQILIEVIGKDNTLPIGD